VDGLGVFVCSLTEVVHEGPGVHGPQELGVDAGGQDGPGIFFLDASSDQDLIGVIVSHELETPKRSLLHVQVRGHPELQVCCAVSQGFFIERPYSVSHPLSGHEDRGLDLEAKDRVFKDCVVGRCHGSQLGEEGDVPVAHVIPLTLIAESGSIYRVLVSAHEVNELNVPDIILKI
jgi:hypothetical protein